LRKSFPSEELEQLLGVPATSWERIESGGYGRVSAHWRVSLADGGSVFVKHALTPEAQAWLRQERFIFENVTGSFMPVYLGAYDDGRDVFLVLEDLGGADWPPPWSAERIDAVLGALAELRAATPPEGIDRLDAQRESIVGWPAVAADPEPLLSTGICTRDWLEHAMPALLRAGQEAVLGGQELLHCDVRSDNLCFKDGRAVLVDWNLACMGNGEFDVAFWLPSLRLEGGPQPWEVLPDAGAIAAAVGGFFAARCGLPPPSGAPTVRAFQLRQLEVALPWAAREVGQAPP
jgi:Phosphotransferase enzyme family